MKHINLHTGEVTDSHKIDQHSEWVAMDAIMQYLDEAHYGETSSLIDLNQLEKKPTKGFVIRKELYDGMDPLEFDDDE